MSNNGSKWIRPARRWRIYARDRYVCVYCAEGLAEGHMLTLDHVVALEYGGTHHHTNLVTALFFLQLGQAGTFDARFSGLLEIAGLPNAADPATHSQRAPPHTTKGPKTPMPAKTRTTRQKTLGGLARTRGVVASTADRVEGWARNANSNALLMGAARDLKAAYSALTRAFDSLQALPENFEPKAAPRRRS